ncbi:MAG: homoserine dehydrogenase [Roseiflexaceae bacterium]
MTTTYRLVMIGFGSVGQGFAQILQRRAAWLEEQYGVALRLVGVGTRSWCSYDPAGLVPGALLDAAAGRGQPPAPQAWSPLELVARAEADVLVEVSSTDLGTGEPATSHIRTAFGRGMHVVTANKGPIALHGRALLAEAVAAGRSLGFEGTVMSGTPALRLGWSALAGSDLRAVRGIVNGTTNYILSQMDGGAPYAEALAEAQRLGYAETDPTGDVEGHDAAGKAVILANMLLGGALRPGDVEREGITRLTPADIAAAHAAGERWKLLAHVAREGGRVTASVRPVRLPASHPLASVGGATNALTFDTDLLGEVTLIGPGAGGVATGFALLSDILALPRD